LAKAGIKDQHNLNIFKTIGNASYTEFYYKVSCDKSQHKTVISLLKMLVKTKVSQILSHKKNSKKKTTLVQKVVKKQQLKLLQSRLHKKMH
jgi:hypothetical protein